VVASRHPRRPHAVRTLQGYLLDVRIEPGIFGREHGVTIVSAGRDEVTLAYTTWVAP